MKYHDQVEEDGMNNRQPARLWVKNEMSWSRCLLKVSVLLLIQTVSSAQSQSPQDLFRAAEPAVVRLDILDETGKVIAHGSGFLVSTDGRFLTNFHVVKGARQITVRLSNDDAYDTVEVVDVDRRKDIALLKIKGVDLPILQLGKSADVKVGDPILCIGTPLGQESLKNTLSNGIVSGIRSANGYRLFQVTAPVSQGSSGGPVLSMRGEVIGIVVANVPDAQT